MSYVGVSARYFIYFISGQTIRKQSFKIRVAYNIEYRKIFRVSRCMSASGMSVSNDIPKFEAFLRKSTYLFTSRI